MFQIIHDGKGRIAVLSIFRFADSGINRYKQEMLRYVMGYMGNQLATVSTGAFAAVLTGLWPWFMGFAPVLNFIFIMAVTVTWFLTFACWFSQRSADYMTKWNEMHHRQEAVSTSAGSMVQVHSSGAEDPGLIEDKTKLNEELNELRNTVEMKDSEIKRLKKEIANLETRVQVEELKTELANIKAMAAKK